LSLTTLADGDTEGEVAGTPEEVEDLRHGRETYIQTPDAVASMALGLKSS
jgi:hypothetical protein